MNGIDSFIHSCYTHATHTMAIMLVIIFYYKSTLEQHTYYKEECDKPFVTFDENFI